MVESRGVRQQSEVLAAQAERETAEERASLERYYRSLTPEQRRERIQLQAAYRDAYNEITEAHQRVELPRYFWRRWVPILGPTASMVYMRLRDLCFSRAGENAGVCEPTQEELAQAVGLSKRHTVGAALRLLEQHGFMTRKRIHTQDPRTGRLQRAADQISVYFEVPLHTEDAVDLLILESRQVQLELHREAEKRPLVTPPDSEGPKNGLSVEVVGVQPKGRKTASNGNGKRNGIYRCLSTTVVDSPQAHLAADLAEEFRDPGSARFFLRVTSRLPEPLVRRLLSETLAAEREGTLRGRPGAYFTAAVKREAHELGIDL